MDYKYIEQLVDRYFACETSLEEEQILRVFFAQETVPVSLLQYRQLFVEQTKAKQEVLSDDFDKRILAMVNAQESETAGLSASAAEPKRVKARMISMPQRLRPLYKAAACVAVVLALGQAAQMPYSEREAEQENIARSMEKPDIQKDENAVAKSDSAAREKTVTSTEVLSN